MTTETATGVMLPQTKDYLRPSEAGRGKDGFLPEASKDSMALLTPYFQTSGLQYYKRINFCCFKLQSTSLWYFVTATLGD